MTLNEALAVKARGLTKEQIIAHLRAVAENNLRADIRQRGAAEAFENIVDPPDREGRGQKAHDHAHDNAAEPIRGGVPDTSKHKNLFRLFPRRRGKK